MVTVVIEGERPGVEVLEHLIEGVLEVDDVENDGHDAHDAALRRRQRGVCNAGEPSRGAALGGAGDDELGQRSRETT